MSNNLDTEIGNSHISSHRSNLGNPPITDRASPKAQAKAEQGVVPKNAFTPIDAVYTELEQIMKSENVQKPTGNANSQLLGHQADTGNPFIASKDLYRTNARVRIPKVEPTSSVIEDTFMSPKSQPQSWLKPKDP